MAHEPQSHLIAGLLPAFCDPNLTDLKRLVACGDRAQRRGRVCPHRCDLCHPLWSRAWLAERGSRTPQNKALAAGARLVGPAISACGLRRSILRSAHGHPFSQLAQAGPGRSCWARQVVGNDRAKRSSRVLDFGLPTVGFGAAWDQLVCGGSHAAYVAARRERRNRRARSFLSRSFEVYSTIQWRKTQ